MSASRIKGMSARLVQTPGYHIHPQYDLVHVRHLLEERRNRRKGFTLMLAPMVDMFSILVIYLLMNFSSDGDVFFVSKDVPLPHAARGTPMHSLPLISIVGPNVMFDAEKSENGLPSSIQELNDEKVPQLRDLLKRVQALQAQITPGQPFKGEINLQAGINTPADEVKKVMRVLISEGWSGINFVVDPSQKGEP
jgi:biopolymer transport protein ExbD